MPRGGGSVYGGGSQSVFGGSGRSDTPPQTPTTSTAALTSPAPSSHGYTTQDGYISQVELEEYDVDEHAGAVWHKTGAGDYRLSLTLDLVPEGTVRGMRMLIGTKVDEEGEVRKACTQLLILFNRKNVPWLWKDFILDLEFTLVPGRHCERTRRDENSVTFKFMATTTPLGELESTKGWIHQQRGG